jgi:cobalt-zinc-cadmium efflux system membrane fusion protein
MGGAQNDVNLDVFDGVIMKANQKQRLFHCLVIGVSACLTAIAPERTALAFAAPQTHDHDASEESESAQCAQHHVIENDCGICHPEFAASLAPGQGLKIRFATAESVSRAGISTTAPSIESISNGVECYAEIMFDRNRTAQVVSPVDGVLEEVGVDLGDRVRSGIPLARISSAEIAEVQGEYLRALSDAKLRTRSYERERALFADRIASERDVEEAAAAGDAAGAALQQAKKRLRVLGFDDVQIDSLESSGIAALASLALRSPIEGEIIERDAVRGGRVESGKTLFVIADRSVMWGMLNIPEIELSHVRVGQRVEFTPDAIDEDGRSARIAGKITWVSSQVDARTRMARARAEIRDGAGTIRSGMFARAWIETTVDENAIVVPEHAVQHVEDRPFVFVKIAEDLYEARAVALGTSRNGRIEVTEGLGPSEQVAVTGSFIVKSELLKSRLGAGCADD